MLSYFIFGYADSARGAVMPNFLESNALSDDMGGIIAVLHYGGYCLAVIIFGVLAYYIPKKFYLLSANIASLCGVLLYAFGSGILSFVGVLSLGFSLGLYEFCGNAVIRDVYPPEKRAKYVNILSSFHSLGAVVAPLLLGLIFISGMSWTFSLNLIIPVILISALIFFFIKWKPSENENAKKAEKNKLSDYLHAFKEKATLPYYALAFFYIAAESVVIMWLTTYLNDNYGYAPETAAMWLSVFFFCQVGGRFIGGFIVDALGYKMILAVSPFLGGLCILLGTILPMGFEILIPLSGIFFSVIFPTIAAAISLVSKQKEDITMGAFYVFAALGGVVGGYLTSLINTGFGMQAGFISAAVFAFLVGAIGIKLAANKKKSNE